MKKEKTRKATVSIDLSYTSVEDAIKTLEKFNGLDATLDIDMEYEPYSDSPSIQYTVFWYTNKPLYQVTADHPTMYICNLFNVEEFEADDRVAWLENLGYENIIKSPMAKV